MSKVIDLYTHTKNNDHRHNKVLRKKRNFRFKSKRKVIPLYLAKIGGDFDGE